MCWSASWMSIVPDAGPLSWWGVMVPGCAPYSEHVRNGIAIRLDPISHPPLGTQWHTPAPSSENVSPAIGRNFHA